MDWWVWEWWVWLALGLVLLVIEMATPSGFFIMFFGLGALLVGILSRLGLGGPPWAQWLIFTASSVTFTLLFRDRLRQRIRQPTGIVDSMIGELATPRERILPGGFGGVEVRGAHWRARNDSAVPVDPGQRCRVVSVDNLMVGIQPE
jgi:membrane protein implicated in regulation of membrane protease activity